MLRGTRERPTHPWGLSLLNHQQMGKCFSTDLVAHVKDTRRNGFAIHAGAGIFLRFSNLVADCIPHELRGSGEIELAHDVQSVRVDRLEADGKMFGDRFVGLAFGDQLNYLSFSVRDDPGQTAVGRCRPMHCTPPATARATPRDVVAS
jgi:hypothetical protein